MSNEQTKVLSAQHKLVTKLIATLIKDLQDVSGRIVELSLVDQGALSYNADQLQKALDKINTNK